ncbi:unannotated protein [freshwater metagenome]|uniref:Unannotated protein n=1 Tax=freshwater metagenome TaxID=449393 RepID=A0A6J6HJC9_9ZZZZ
MARLAELADMANPQREITKVATAEMNEPSLIGSKPPFKTSWAIRNTTKSGITCSLDFTSDESKRPVTIAARAVSVSAAKSSKAGESKKTDWIGGTLARRVT